MTKLVRWISAYCLVVMVAGAATAACAQDRESLENDFSRADLFKLMLDRLQEAAPLPEKNLFRPQGFSFPRDAIWDDADSETNPRKNSIFGIDVSHHNERACACKIDWSAIQAQKIAFAYVKASQGTKHFDKRFDEHWRDLEALPAGQKILRGAYHFLSADGSGADQAENFLGVIGKLNRSDLPPSLDLEWDVRTSDRKIILGSNGKARDFWDSFSPQEIIDRALEWLKIVEARTGRIPVVYTNRAWWNERIKDEKQFAALSRYKVWIADYSKNGRAQEIPSVPNRGKWHLWQFTASANFTQGGISTVVDANIFKGTEKEFRTALDLPDK
jgi:lysozyme